MNIRLFWECLCEISDSLSSQTATDMEGKIQFHEKCQYFTQLALEPLIARIFSFFSSSSTMQKVVHSIQHTPIDAIDLVLARRGKPDQEPPLRDISMKVRRLASTIFISICRHVLLRKYANCKVI